jgi:Phosphoribosylanthranilate isomerase
MRPYVDAVNYFLLDAYVPGEAGGTGETFNWELAVKAKDLGKPIFLAGGLTPENLAEAIEKVMPFAVDVASGVERLPRRKDYDKMNAFIRKARGLK